MNSFNKTEAAIFHVQAMLPSDFLFPQFYETTNDRHTPHRLYKHSRLWQLCQLFQMVTGHLLAKLYFHKVISINMRIHVAIYNNLSTALHKMLFINKICMYILYPQCFVFILHCDLATYVCIKATLFQNNCV